MGQVQGTAMAMAAGADQLGSWRKSQCASIAARPENQWIVLLNILPWQQMPEFIMKLTLDKMAQIRFLYYKQATVMGLIDDAEFPDTLAESFEELIAMVEAAK
jgi:hypothetical protein